MNFYKCWSKRRFERLMNKISIGGVVVCDADYSREFGQSDSLPSMVTVNRNRFYRKSLMGAISIAESYVDGDWDCPDLTSLIQIFLQNRQVIDNSNRWDVRVANFGYRLFHWLHSNTRCGSLRNIAAHYDLGNDFYQLWLDDTMAYSAGIFLNEKSTLKEASVEKLDRVCRKLDLQPHENLLEIGTGFGGLALHAAENYDCDVTTTTISQRQFDYAQDRFYSSIAQDRIHLLQEDYRELSGKYDKLVSIEMIEAVGHGFLDQYFQKCSRLLRDDGSMLIQVIVMPERRYGRYLKSVDFIQRYIFPGGNLPSLAAILESVGRASDLRFVHAEDMAPHYAETLKRWRIDFLQHRDQIEKQGYSTKFMRLWEFYLSYCEAAFAQRQIGVLQIQLDKPNCGRDPIQIGHRAANFAAKLSSRPLSNSSRSPELTQPSRPHLVTT